MAFDLAAVTSFINGLTITGVTIHDFNEIRDATDIRECPILQPNIGPDNPITFQSFTRDTFGSGTTAKQTLIYNVPYILLFEPTGSGRGLQDILPDMVTTLSAVVTAFIQNDFISAGNATVDLLLSAFTLGQVITDPAGAQFFGSSITIQVKEFVN